MKINTRVRIGNNNIYIGKGVREFLEAIDKYESISKASKVTKISYPKAMRMLKTIEDELGFSAVISEKGGTTHGGTVLSEKGRILLNFYKDIEVDIENYANNLIRKKFPF